MSTKSLKTHFKLANVLDVDIVEFLKNKNTHW